MPLRKKRMKPPKPAPDAFKRRLVVVMEVAGLNVADLHCWFEREYVTVYSWVHHGKVPRPSFRTDDLYSRLALLERIIARGVAGLPMPSSLSQRLRADHVRRIYKDARGPIARRTAWRR